jgi:hypothetical protein
LCPTSQTGETIHFIYRDGTLYPTSPDLAFTASSTIKIPVMIHTYAEEGPTIPEVTASLVHEMISRSENPATDDLMAELGESDGPLRVTEMLQTLGFSDTFIAGYFYNGAPLLQVIHTPANSRTDIDSNPDIYNQTTPSSAIILEDIYHCARLAPGPVAAPGKITRASCQGDLCQGKWSVPYRRGSRRNHRGPQARLDQRPGGHNQEHKRRRHRLHAGRQLCLDHLRLPPRAKCVEPVSICSDLSEAIYNYFNLPE